MIIFQVFNLCKLPYENTVPSHDFGIFLSSLGKCFFKKTFYLFIHERHKERKRWRHRQREKQAPCSEPNVGLDPGSPGSRPGPKAGAQLLSHPGVPLHNILTESFSTMHLFPSTSLYDQHSFLYYGRILLLSHQHKGEISFALQHMLLTSSKNPVLI